MLALDRDESQVSHLFWGVWAVFQSFNSLIDFDYLMYGKTRFDEYHRRKDAFMAL